MLGYQPIHGLQILLGPQPMTARAVNGYPGTRVPAGNGTTRVMKMLPGYPFKALMQLKIKPIHASFEQPQCLS